MTWNIFYHDINADEIQVRNIFDHGGFRNDVKSHKKKCKTKDGFAEELRRSLSYYFRSKCEWEVLISPWVFTRKDRPKKVDVYWQVMNNWDVFVDYVWNYKEGK